ncbi:hypothetical protein SAMN05216247_12135 [Pseudomonas salomonii]|uniref:Uncharacterized protein n=1 Tax=Pseudomonas salomonii TaxID=191391 RepID=A0A1H3V0U3_9PSED|nr:hypothetical protein SAMN05216247_12135 [Pseudomonas salomonii]
MWERACSRMRCDSQHMKRLIHRIREQARSHTYRFAQGFSGVAGYLAAQELKRCSSCSPLSAQKLTSICTWLAMFSGVVGMSFSTSLANNGTAWVLAGP